MGADAVHVFYGIRETVTSESELTSLEERNDPRLERARKARLKTSFGRPIDGEPYFLFIGHHFGTFGVENKVEAALAESEVRTIMEETNRRLKEAGFDPAAAKLHIQLEAQY